MITATQIKVGMVLVLEGGKLARVMATEHVTPGKGNAFIRAKVRMLADGTQQEKRYRSSEAVERAFLDTRSIQFLYQEGDSYHFMDSENYEQFHLDKEMIGDAVAFLKPSMELTAENFEGKPIGVELPKVVQLEVTETEPYIKTATATNQFKSATLETGAVIQVPGFISQGEIVEIDTTTGKYLNRAKN